jgi:adenylate cyclase
MAKTGAQVRIEEDLSGRLARAFEAEELAATKRAMQASLAAIAGVVVLVLTLVPLEHALYYVGILTVFAAMVVVHYALRSRRFARPWHGYVFAVAVYALFAYAAFVPNPLHPDPWPPQMMWRMGLFVYSFVFLVPFAFSYAPLLMFWAGVACVVTWSLGMAWLYSLPGTLTESAITEPWTAEEDLALFLHPYYVRFDTWIQNVVVMLIVTGALAAVVARARKMVYRQANAERERTNLARYFPPKVVDRLADLDEPLGRVRAQPVAVLFADIVGFTRLAEHTDPEGVVALLRVYHERLEHAVFHHGGTLDKFLGDGIMATFGTPEPGPRDALDAINCAKAMLESVDAWNAERRTAGEPEVRLSIGIHYGEAVLGNIGSSRRLEFAVLGDVVNVSSRLEELTRGLGCPLVVGDALMQAARDQADDREAGLLEDFRDRGLQTIRGRDQGVSVWSLATSAA